MTKVRTPLLLVVAALLAALMVPTNASADPSSERERVRDERAAVAAELDAISASDDELVAALVVLSEQVQAQTAAVESARQAVVAAEAQLAAAIARVEDSRSLITRLRAAVVERAVTSFIRPDAATFDDVMESKDITEAARKSALLDQVAADDQDVIDALDAAREDFELQQAAAQVASAKADERRANSEARLGELERTRAAQRQRKADLDARRQSVLSEANALAAVDANLTRIIEAAERAAALEASRSAAPVASVLPGGAGSGGCIWPARGSVTSEYGMRWGRLHAGIDISAPTGTAIWAAKSGTVIFSGWQNGYGNVVILLHGGGLTTLYGHQSRRAASVGQGVGQGQTIGYVGSTGNSTGPHLHFETRYGGVPRNPRGCLS